MIQKFTINNAKRTHVIMSSNHNLGKNNKQKMELKTIDDKVVNERPRPYGANLIESSSQSFQLWLDLGIFKEIHGSSWNNNLLPISKEDKSKSIKDKLERKQKKENLLEKKFNEKSFRFVIDSKQLKPILKNTNTYKQ